MKDNIYGQENWRRLRRGDFWGQTLKEGRIWKDGFPGEKEVTTYELLISMTLQHHSTTEFP